MLFLINEQKKKTTKGGKGLCRVFLVQNNGVYDEVVDITKRIAEMGIGLKYYDGLTLTYHYGSGTGLSRISELLRLHRGDDIQIQNISIF